MRGAGYVLDAENDQPIPEASLTIVDGKGVPLAPHMSADDDGFFYIDHPLLGGNSVLVSSAGYMSSIIPADLLQPTDPPEIALYRSDGLDPVTVTPRKKNNLLWALVIIVVAKMMLK